MHAHQQQHACICNSMMDAYTTVLYVNGDDYYIREYDDVYASYCTGLLIFANNQHQCTDISAPILRALIITTRSTLCCDEQ